VILDLDGDGDERTGWTIFYFHVSPEGQVQKGAVLKKGDPIGHPSCEGGRATGTHIHIARRYNGEWIPASGVLAFNLEGWVAHAGAVPYLGTLKRNARVVTACTCSDMNSQLESESK
jgi:murein DD-endopeptidase MepM/ murein hydrolase activator NlpD